MKLYRFDKLTFVRCLSQMLENTRFSVIRVVQHTNKIKTVTPEIGTVDLSIKLLDGTTQENTQQLLKVV